jgi:S-adenosylmethionine synthetase
MKKMKQRTTADGHPHHTWQTAESVSPAHPDKLCDQISDLILTECLRQDPAARVACEVMGGHGQIWITGEISTRASVDYVACARQVLADNRYDPNDYQIHTHIAAQSPEIANGVDT